MRDPADRAQLDRVGGAISLEARGRIREALGAAYSPEIEVVIAQTEPVRNGMALRRLALHRGAGGTMLLVTLGWVAGCGHREPDPVAWPDAEPVELIGLWPPVGPDDPLVVRLSDPTLPADPEIRDPDGNLVAVAPVTYDGAAVAPFGWRPDDGWVPGAYALRRVGPLSDVDETFTVGPYGVEGIDPASLVGRAWRATGAVSTSGLEGLALATGTPIVAIEDADADGTVGFVVAVELADGASCMVLRDRASFDGSRSRLSWAWDEASIAPSGGDPVEAWDLWAQLDYLADGTGAAGRAHAEVDLQSLDPDCGLISTFGVACRPCPGGGAPTCRREDIDQIQLVETEPLVVDDLPLCGGPGDHRPARHRTDRL